MTSGRKPNTTTPQVDPKIDHAAVARDVKALGVMGKRSAEVAERFGDGLPYERERMVTETRYLMGQSAEAMLEAGKRLIQIKENEQWGDFAEIVEQRLGLNLRTAQKMMQAAAKYLSPKLAAKASPVTLLGKAKLFDLMVESDDDLAELAKGGTLAGHTLDEFQAMTRRELQASLKEARQTLDSRQKLLDKANAKADRLKEKLDRPWQSSEHSVAMNAEQAAAMHELSAATDSAVLDIARLGMVVGELQLHRSPAISARAVETIQYIVLHLRDVILSHGIEVRLDEDAIGVRPDWLNHPA